VTEIMRSIHPLSRRIEGIRNDSAITMAPLPIERITAPTLVISARDDLYNTLPAAEHLAKHIPGASLIVLDNGGHLMVGPGVDGTIAEFLKRLETEGGNVSPIRQSGVRQAALTVRWAWQEDRWKMPGIIAGSGTVVGPQLADEPAGPEAVTAAVAPKHRHDA
jgi:hypothetical protein